MITRSERLKTIIKILKDDIFTMELFADELESENKLLKQAFIEADKKLEEIMGDENGHGDIDLAEDWVKDSDIRNKAKEICDS